MVTFSFRDGWNNMLTRKDDIFYLIDLWMIFMREFLSRNNVDITDITAKTVFQKLLAILVWSTATRNFDIKSIDSSWKEIFFWYNRMIQLKEVKKDEALIRNYNGIVSVWLFRLFFLHLFSFWTFKEITIQYSDFFYRQYAKT